MSSKGINNVSVDDIGALSNKYVHKRTVDAHEIDLDRLIFSPVLVEKGTVLVDAPVGTLLARFPLHPKCLWWYKHARKAFATDRMQFDLAQSPASLYANVFDFFKGAMKFKLKLWTSRFHTGELLIVFVPKSQDTIVGSPLSEVDMPTYDAAMANNYACLYHDLKESNEITFGAPYQSADPMQRFEPTPIPGSTLDPNETNGANYYDVMPDVVSAPGEIRIFVSKKIIAPLSLDTAVDFDLWASLDEKDCCFSRLKGVPASFLRFFHPRGFN
jgi:hypothetical protein